MFCLLFDFLLGVLFFLSLRIFFIVFCISESELVQSFVLCVWKQSGASHFVWLEKKEQKKGQVFSLSPFSRLFYFTRPTTWRTRSREGKSVFFFLERRREGQDERVRARAREASREKRLLPSTSTKGKKK